MFRSLRSRLILSHILPLLIVIPVVGIALTYSLETQVLLRNLSTDLSGTASLLARMGAARPELWNDPARAQAFLDEVSPSLNARVLLLDRQGRLLASSDAADRSSVGQPVNVPNLARVEAGQEDVATTYSRRLNADVVGVSMPVIGADGQVLGIVRLTHQLATVYERFLRLRYLIGGILLAGMVLGTAIGWELAVHVQSPLARLTGAIARLAAGQSWSSVPEDGPSEIRLLVHTVNDLMARLNGLERNRRQLLANLVHELGRPLGSLVLAVEALEHGAGRNPELGQELLHGISSEIRRLRRLLDDLALLHEQVTGTLQIVRQVVPMTEWLSHVLPIWRTAAENKGLVWQATVPGDLPQADVDPDRLGQALGNLLSNAIKYSPPGGRVCVDAGSGADVVWISVADDGPGIPPEEQARIFEPLQRGSTGTRFPQGMGLGLAIARELVAAHAGSLHLDSQPGRGSRFTITLPLIS